MTRSKDTRSGRERRQQRRSKMPASPQVDITELLRQVGPEGFCIIEIESEQGVQVVTDENGTPLKVLLTWNEFAKVADKSLLAKLARNLYPHGLY